MSWLNSKVSRNKYHIFTDDVFQLSIGWLKRLVPKHTIHIGYITDIPITDILIKCVAILESIVHVKQQGIPVLIWP